MVTEEAVFEAEEVEVCRDSVKKSVVGLIFIHGMILYFRNIASNIFDRKTSNNQGLVKCIRFVQWLLKIYGSLLLCLHPVDPTCA